MQRETQTETEMRGEEIRWMSLKIKIKVPRQGTLASSRKYDNISEKKGLWEIWEVLKWSQNQKESPKMENTNKTIICLCVLLIDNI